MSGGSQGVTDAVFYGWLVTAIGWVITMGWNFLNRRHSNELAASIRKDNFALDQWNSVRDSIEACLTAFSEAALELSLIHSQTLAELKLQCETSLRILTLKQDLLAQALKTADETYYVDGDDWEPMANGPEVDLETSWDHVVAIGEQIRAARSIAAVKNAILPAKIQVRDICDPIRQRVRVETIKHDPDKS